jgi:hypothetical protein
MTKENVFGSGACTLFSHRVTYSLHEGGSQGMNLEMAGVMHPKTSCASIIWNWLSCNLGDWMTIIVSAYQRRIMLRMDDMNAGLSRREPLNVTAEPGCDLLETNILDVTKSVRPKNRCNASRLETAGPTFLGFLKLFCPLHRHSSYLF